MSPLPAHRSDANHHVETADQVLAALQSVIGDIDTYVASWIDRLNHVVVSHEVRTTSNDSLSRRIAEFEQEKEQWELKRTVDQAQLQDQANQLTEAWLHLEAEQRRFLQLKAGQPSSAHKVGDAGGFAAVPKTPLSSLDEEQRSPAAPPTAGLPSGPALTGRSQVNRSREAAVRQFQRLRREIESSRPSSEIP